MKVASGDPLSRAICQFYLERREPSLRAIEPDAVLPIPMSRRRRLALGTNSPDILAREISRFLRIPAANGLVVRCRKTLLQTDLSPKDRFGNVRSAFRVTRGYDIRGVRILLVDDVITTGATCSEVARILKQAGVVTVGVAVIARGGHKET
jgi:ComF family protein